MQKLTKEEQINLLQEAIFALGKLVQDLAQAPALTIAPPDPRACTRMGEKSELKKMPPWTTAFYICPGLNAIAK